jgi:GT2 family glycosyltransferase
VIELPADVVVPTIGRPSLRTLLEALARGTGARPRRILLVDDRPSPVTPLLDADPPPRLASRVVVLAGRGAGPAAARNVGWRAASAPWVVFLDDDVEPDPDWAERLADDLAEAGPDVAGVQGRIRVPLARDRRPTDWERNVQRLETARWATADFAYRRAVLAEVGGFDERFRRAYREDADLALRVLGAGYRLVTGRRRVAHPVRPAGRWVSVRLQAGNADDALMRALHGPGWREAAGVPRGRRARHVGLVLAALAALAALGARRRRLAAAAGAFWLAGTAELAWARIAPGPRTADEIATMVATSVVLPFAATGHWLAGLARRRRRLAGTARAPAQLKR